MHIPWQTLISTAIVLACMVYATWVLMPRVLKQALWGALHRWSGGAVRPAVARSGCGGSCGGCTPSNPNTKPVTLHRNKPLPK